MPAMTTTSSALNINNSELYVNGELIGVIDQFRLSSRAGLTTMNDVEVLLHNYGIKDIRKYKITTSKPQAFDATMIDTVDGYPTIFIKIKIYNFKKIDELRKEIDATKLMGVV